MKSLWYWLCRGIESSCKGGIAYCVNYLAVWSKFFCTFPAPLSYALLLLFLERNLNFWIDSDGSHSRISKMERADMQKITDSPLLLGIFQVRALEVCLWVSEILCCPYIIIIWTLLMNYFKTQLRMLIREKAVLKLNIIFSGNSK